MRRIFNSAEDGAVLLRFANPRKRIAQAVLDQFVNAADHARVGCLPVAAILPCLLRENEFHGSNRILRSRPLPLFKLEMAERNRRALAGLRNR